MVDKLEKLRFYGLGDEAEELFRLTCRLCYEMRGLGEVKKANLLYKWAKEQADESVKWKEDNEDFITGMSY